MARRISDELAQQGMIITETGVYHVLKRANLNHRLDRLFYAQEHSDNPIIAEQYRQEVEKKKETHIVSFCSSYHVFQDTFKVGTIKGLGRIYQKTGLDELQDDWDNFIYYYNFKRTHQGYRLGGKIPYQKLLDDKRKYALPEPG